MQLRRCTKAFSHVRNTSFLLQMYLMIWSPVTAVDIAEEIVWAASRPPHVNIAELFVLPVNQASATINYRAPKN